MITIHPKGYRLDYQPPDVVVLRDMKKRLQPVADTTTFRGWVVGDTLAETEALLEFAKQYKIPWDEAAAVKAARASNSARLTDRLGENATPRIVAEGLILRAYQTVGAQWLVEKQRTILGDGTGVGKTPTVCVALRDVDQWPAIVVAPTSVIPAWEDEIGRWTQRPVGIVRTRKDPLPNTDIILVSWGLLPDRIVELKALNPRVVVLDEAHRMRSENTARSTAALHLTRGVPYVWPVTGTLLVNGIQDAITVLDGIDRLKELGGRWFIERHFANKQRVRTGWDPVRRQPIFAHAYKKPKTAAEKEAARVRAEDFYDRMYRSGVMLRRTKEEVLKDLPPRTVTPRWIDLEPADRVAYDQTAKGLNNVSQLSALRQLVGSSKIIPALEWLRERLDDNKIVVFYYHNEVGDTIEAALKDYGVVRISGDTSLDKRGANVRALQKNADTRVLVANILAGGEGITLTAASIALFVEPWWTYAAHEQAMDRVHRWGQTRAVEGVFLLARNTVDAATWDVVTGKQHLTDAAAANAVLQRLRGGNI